MFDSLFNLVFLLIPLAVFVGRFVLDARNKREGQSRIPVHFEDDEKPAARMTTPATANKNQNDDEYQSYAHSRGASEYHRGMISQGGSSSTATQSAAVRRNRQSLKPGEAIKPTIGTAAYDARAAAVAGTRPAQGQNSANQVSPGHQPFPLNLYYLSPMKQAVVMAEVLGPPKGMD
jgi:glycine cleavage system aminomethyltransferase T